MSKNFLWHLLIRSITANPKKFPRHFKMSDVVTSSEINHFYPCKLVRLRAMVESLPSFPLCLRGWNIWRSSQLKCLQVQNQIHPPGLSSLASKVVVWSILCCAKVTQSCLTLCNPLDCSLPGSSVHGNLQERILEWVAMPSSRGSSQPRDQTLVSFYSWIADRFFTAEASGKPLVHST